jgi:putative ABC transport system permease protein
MTMVTRQNLLAEKTRFFISVGGVALSVFLISFLLSLFRGWQLSVGRFVEKVDADVWVARDGTTDFLNAASVLPADMQTDLEAVPGVASVDPLIVRPMNVGVGPDKQESLHLVGYDVNGGAGGPPKMAKGRSPPGPGEVVIDKAFADKAGVGIGDTLESGGQQLQIVGLSTGGNLIFSQTSFVSLETARQVLSMNGLTTFFLVHTDDGADADEVSASIVGAEPTVGAFPSGTFAEATRARIMDNLIPILLVILLLAFIVGVAITGLTIYNATVEKAREYGILKAIGFTNGYLFRLVLEQSLATGILGFVIGGAATVVASRFIASLVPQFVTLVRWQDFGYVFVATIVMAGMAALLPVRRLAGVDPVAVFSG